MALLTLIPYRKAQVPTLDATLSNDERLYYDQQFTYIQNTLISVLNWVKPYSPNIYTVATLPAATTALQGSTATVTDATLPSFLGTLTGGGAVVCPVFCNGTAWVAG